MPYLSAGIPDVLTCLDVIRMVLKVIPALYGAVGIVILHSFSPKIFFFIFLLCGVLVFNNHLSVEFVYYVVLKLHNKKG